MLSDTPFVYISGLHSGTNPLPGIGVALSLRQRWPKAFLVGVDYSPESSGLSHPVFDDVLVLDGWSTIVPRDHRNQVVGLVERSSGFWISCLDLEVEMLCGDDPHPAILSPQTNAALRAVDKGAGSSAQCLGLLRPESIVVGSHDEAHAFLTEHAWRCWAKPPRYTAYPISSWSSYVNARNRIQALWGNVPILLEQHIEGAYYSIAFCAREGLLLGAVGMKKDQVTSEGKVWAGRVEPVDDSMLHSLQNFCLEHNWTGGAELEMIVSGGMPYLMEINPRFPAWIHGSTILGHNLPATLVSGLAQKDGMNRAQQGDPRAFTRVVLEIAKQDAKKRNSDDAHHPSGMPSLSRRLSGAAQGKRLSQFAGYSGDRSCTPHYTLDVAQLRGRITESLDWSERQRSLKVKLAYSAKTNPSKGVLEVVQASGLMADAITVNEWSALRKAGFPTDHIILNGPAKLWQNGTTARLKDVGCHSIHFDSIAEWNRLRPQLKSAQNPPLLGLRIRPSELNSHFGVLVTRQLDSPETDALKEMSEVGHMSLQFHFAYSQLGEGYWNRLRRFIDYVGWLNEHVCGGKVRQIDIGGGWTYSKWSEVVQGRCTSLDELLVHAASVGIGQCIVEPGKAIVQDSGTLVGQVLDVRVQANRLEVVTDLSRQLLPDQGSHPHAVEWVPGILDNASGLRSPMIGDIYGPTCMESDVLERDILIPGELNVGDLVVVRHCGAYDISMANAFGIGTTVFDALHPSSTRARKVS